MGLDSTPKQGLWEADSVKKAIESDDSGMIEVEIKKDTKDKLNQLKRTFIDQQVGTIINRLLILELENGGDSKEDIQRLDDGRNLYEGKRSFKLEGKVDLDVSINTVYSYKMQNMERPAEGITVDTDKILNKRLIAKNKLGHAILELDVGYDSNGRVMQIYLKSPRSKEFHLSRSKDRQWMDENTDQLHIDVPASEEVLDSFQDELTEVGDDFRMWNTN